MKPQTKQRLKSILIAIIVCTFLVLQPAHTKAQDSSNYFSVSYIKLKDPANAEQYESGLTDYSKKMVEYRVKNNAITGWYLWKVIMPVGTSAEYDYVVVVSSKDPQVLMDDTTMSAVFKAVYPDDKNQSVRQSMISTLNSLRTVVKKEIYSNVTGFAGQGKMPSYVEVDYMKPAAGKYDDYIKSEKETWMLVHKERMKLNALAGWELDSKILPASDNAQYDFVTVNYFYNLPSMLDPKYTEAFKTVWPKLDINTVFTSTGNLRSIVKSDILKLVDYVDAGNAK
jgi:hypothetical protein